MIGPSLLNRQLVINHCLELMNEVGAIHDQQRPVPDSLVAQLEAALIDVNNIALSDAAVRAATRNVTISQREEQSMVDEGIQMRAREWTADLVKPDTFKAACNALKVEFATAITQAAKREEEAQKRVGGVN